MTSHNCSFFNGYWTKRHGNSFANINPYRPEDTLENYFSAHPDDIEEALQSANDAFLEWRSLAGPLRGDLLNRVADAISRRVDAIGHDMATEEGKTVAEAISEAQNAAAQFRFAASMTMQPHGSVIQARDGRTKLLYSIREPLGVVVAITPWNFPISIPAWKIAHALAEGNTVVWKPAELTPRTSIHLAEAFVEADAPRGVFNMLLGTGTEIGSKLLKNRFVRAVTFTGSNQVGRQIAMSLAATNTKVQLELGGSNPAIVLEGADVDRAAREIANGAFMSSGQKCTATARVIVQQTLFDEFTDALSSLVCTWKTGDPLKASTHLGPVASQAQFSKVASIVRSIPKRSLVCGTIETSPEQHGYIISPHIATNRHQDFEPPKTEIFGPVTILSSVDSFDEALASANSTPFGLSASIFTNDLELAAKFLTGCDAGVVKVNKSTTGNEIHVPFGGHKESGSGTAEMGWASRDFFTKWKTVYIDS